MNLCQSLKKIPHLSALSSISRKYKIDLWLIGGFLRDSYLKKPKELLDFDFCVEKNTLKLVKAVAKKLATKFIVLDKKQQSYRVILKLKNKLYSYDFTRMRAKDFKQDLALRDFSINTLAVNLSEKKPELIDYFGARGDLKRKTLRVIEKGVISSDPLRILRGFSFAANYGFKIEPETLKLMVKSRKLLKKVSRERINEELFKILAAGNSYKVIEVMNGFKIIDEFIPYFAETRRVRQGAYHHLDVCKHSIEALKQFEQLYSKNLVKNKDFSLYLGEEFAKNRRRIQIIKLACLLHDIGKPLAKKKLKKKTIFHTHEKIGRDLADKIAKGLRLSFREREVLKKLIFWHLRPGYLADQIIPTQRAVYRFFRDAEGEGAAVVFLSLSDWRATCGPQTSPIKRKAHEKIMLSLVDDYFLAKRKKPLPKLINGHDIMRKFKLKPSSLIGEILLKVKEEQELGKISNKAEAYKLAKKRIGRKV